jgi:hypothetical protein
LLGYFGTVKKLLEDAMISHVASVVFIGALMLLSLTVGSVRELRKEKALVPVKIF